MNGIRNRISITVVELSALSYIMCLVSFSCVQYLQDLNCPFGDQEKNEAVDWLLGLAVRYEYGDNGKVSLRCNTDDAQ